MSTTIIGIDPGYNGGIAFLGDATQVYVMPTIQYTAPPRKGRKHDRIVREYDEGVIVSLLGGLGPNNAFAFIELSAAQSRFDVKLKKHVPQGAVTNFNTGFGFGLLRGMLAAMQIPYQIVAPKVWQKAMFGGLASQDTKAMSTIVAGRLFPGVDLRKSDRCRVLHDGKCDALLIAEWGRRTRK